jgi:hypothetical protein
MEQTWETIEFLQNCRIFWAVKQLYNHSLSTAAIIQFSEITFANAKEKNKV